MRSQHSVYYTHTMSRHARRLQYAAKPTPLPASAYGVGWHITAANVGLASLGIDGTALPLYTGPSKPASGTVITDVQFDSGLDLSNGSIRIERCLFRPTSVGQGMPLVTTTDYNTFVPVPAPVVIKDCDFDGTLLSQFSAAWCTAFMGIADLSNNYIHHFGSGIANMGTGSQFDCIVEHNYVWDLVSWGNPATDGNHCDAYTVRDFTNTVVADRQLTVRNNRFDCTTTNATGAFFIQGYADLIANLTASNNYLEGLGYQMILEYHNNGYTNIRATNNRFSGTGYGAGYITGGEGYAFQQENYLYDANAPDGKGAPVVFTL